MTTLPFPTRSFAAPSAGQPLHDAWKEVRLGVAIIGIFAVGLTGWAAFARLDSALHAPGVVRVAGNRQVVQSASGGVVSAIDVREGSWVKAGQILVEMAGVEAIAQERSLASRAFSLQAEIARLEAEQAGTGRVTAPADWAALTGDDRRMADHALASEQANLDAQRAADGSESGVIEQRILQLRNQISGYHVRQQSNQRQSDLFTGELRAAQTLLDKGLTTRPRVSALERSSAAVAGDIGATSAEIARLNNSIGEARLQLIQSRMDLRQQRVDRLRLAQTELQALLPQQRAARAQLELTRVRAPVSGTVLGLATNTVGGVVAPGARLMEIVPQSDNLEVETQVAIESANDLRSGQEAIVQINAAGAHDLPRLHGRVTRVSEDSVTDTANNRSFFTATISVPRSELAKLSHAAGLNRLVRAGTPTTVVVPLKARTALQYWLEPLLHRFDGALSEK